MTIETTIWDSAELLDSPEAVAAYLEAALEDGDQALIIHALGVAARAEAKFKDQPSPAREAFGDMLAANADPKLSTFLAALKSLGMKISVHAA
jgi:probable addiction module antidote protein